MKKDELNNELKIPSRIVAHVHGVKSSTVRASRSREDKNLKNYESTEEDIRAAIEDIKTKKQSC